MDRPMRTKMFQLLDQFGELLNANYKELLDAEDRGDELTLAQEAQLRNYYHMIQVHDGLVNCVDDFVA